MVLVIDNYDSFTYNLVQYLGEITEVTVARNDKITLRQIENMAPDRIVISPGPGRPKDAGVSVALINYFREQIPILGVCLGHQCVGKAFGACIGEADRIIHGKISQIFIKDRTCFLFNNVDNPFSATRYHSLIVNRTTIPPELKILASTAEGEIMALGHVTYPVFGVQFHPESILTGEGKKILKNFISFNRRDLYV